MDEWLGQSNRPVLDLNGFDKLQLTSYSYQPLQVYGKRVFGVQEGTVVSVNLKRKNNEQIPAFVASAIGLSAEHMAQGNAHLFIK